MTSGRVLRIGNWLSRHLCGASSAQRSLLELVLVGVALCVTCSGLGSIRVSHR